MLKPGGFINLKTDNDALFAYTKIKISEAGIKPEVVTNDLYNSPYTDELLSVKTFYEKKYLKENKNINYLKFSFNEQ